MIASIAPVSTVPTTVMRPPRTKRGAAYLLAGFPDLAVPMFERILQLDPANEGGRWFRVLAYAWKGDYERAIETGED